MVCWVLGAGKGEDIFLLASFKLYELTRKCIMIRQFDTKVNERVGSGSGSTEKGAFIYISGRHARESYRSDSTEER